MPQRERVAAALAAAWLLLAPPLAGAAAAQQITVTRLADLSFGTVAAGTAKRVAPGDPGAGQFRVDAPPSARIRLDFILPTVLTSAGQTMAVTFGNRDAAWSGQNDVTTATTFDPNRRPRIRVPASGTIYVWIGGSVAPAATQPSGIYTAPLTLSASVR